MQSKLVPTVVAGASCAVLLGYFFAGGAPAARAPAPGAYTVVGFNDLGMHCMQEDFSEICILPPYNTLRAQVIERGEEPEILTSDVSVIYSVPNHMRASDKTNFWTFAPQLFGVQLAPDVGLTGNRLSGTMAPRKEEGIWEVTGIPLVPVDDAGRLDPYPLGLITVTGSQGTATTRAVLPVSSEMSCSLCHNTPGISVAQDILLKHDSLHGTHLVDQKPVLCASCHADPALGAPGQPGVSMLSHAMHGSHAPHAASSGLDNDCYACHPGVRTQCQRDVHHGLGIQCTDCHGGMSAVGNPARIPWTDQPRCSDCHNKPGSDYEQPGKLFKDSIGHGGIYCVTCHGAPHAIGPATTPVDNLQAITLQGHAGPINTCIVCHTSQPKDSFFHKVKD
ncbi:MAG: hypothetical protein SGJ11_15000 [Phycisphaerae bacterium]|nr:hypothetical protein [Phycisphaerae bacterium]